MAQLGTQTVETETSRLGTSHEFIMQVANTLTPGAVLSHSEESALFSEALKFRFGEVRQESGETVQEIWNTQACYLWLVDGVNYMQYYIVPTRENILSVIALLESSGVQFAKEDQKREFEVIKTLMRGDDAKQQQAFIESISSLRLFDARGKHLDAGKALPLSIDMKFKSTQDGKSRSTLKVAAIQWLETNTNEKLITLIDSIIEKVGEKNLWKIYRRFFSLEWLPSEVVHYFIHTDGAILAASVDKQQQIWELLAKHFSVKLDVRFDEIETPSGETVSSVTEEAEVDMDPNTPDELISQVRDTVGNIHTFVGESFSRKNKVAATVGALHEAIHTSFQKQDGGRAYDSSVLDAATLALWTPTQKMQEVLRSDASTSEEVEAILTRMQAQVQAVWERLWFARENQVVVTPKKADDLVKKGFTMSEVWEKIDTILKS